MIMKKLLITVLVLSFALTVSASAKKSEYGLQYTPGVEIDGVMSDGEWDGAVKISLDRENTGMWANFYDENSRLPLYAYFLYGDEGIYVAADIYDNDVDTENMHDCFEVAFNPDGLIPDGDSLEGLFFTFWLDGDKIVMKRHNRFDGDQTGEYEDGAVCRYKTTDHGYTVEALIKWEWLALSDRPVYNRKTKEYKTGVLDKFDHDADGAYVNAIVCYLNGNGEDDAPYRCVYRTVTEPSRAGNFSTATYDIKFTFEDKPEQTTAAETETVTETETGAVTEEQTKLETEKITETDTASETRAKRRKAALAVAVIIFLIVAAVTVVTVTVLKKRRQEKV